MVGCSNSCCTNSSGDSALTASSLRPAALRSRSLPLVRRERGRAAFPGQDVAHYRYELVMPTAQRICITQAELAKRRNCPRNIGPPFQRAAVACQERDIE